MRRRQYGELLETIRRALSLSPRVDAPGHEHCPYDSGGGREEPTGARLIELCRSVRVFLEEQHLDVITHTMRSPTGSRKANLFAARSEILHCRVRWPCVQGDHNPLRALCTFEEVLLELDFQQRQSKSQKTGDDQESRASR
jgi:hypothetical protein